MTTLPIISQIIPTTESRMGPARFQWKEIASMIAVALAIAGLCAALIMGQVWFAVGFGLLGASSVLGWKLARSQAEWNRLGATMHQLRASHTQLQNSERELNTALEQIQSQQKSLLQNIDSLRQENSSLEKTNRQMSSSNKELQTINKNLQHSQIVLREQKQQLEAQLQGFANSISLVQGEITQFIAQDMDFAKHIGAISDGVNRMNSIDGRIATDAKNLHQSVETLSQLIKTQADLSKTVREYLHEQTQQFNTSVRRLSFHLKKMPNFLPAPEGEANETVEVDANAKSKELESLLKQLSGVRQDFEKEKNSLEAIRRDLQELEERRQKKNEEINEMHEKLQKLIQVELPAATRLLEQKIKQTELSQKTLKELNTAIDKKIEDAQRKK